MTNSQVHDSMVRAINVCCSINIKDIPININHRQLMVRDLVTWRLEHGI